MAELRRCIGSERFGIEAHDAPLEDFPTQPSQRDGLGRMCAEHWRAYTAGLARDAKARKAASQTEASVTSVPITEPAAEEPPSSEPPAKRPRRAKNPEPVVDGQGDAG
jgi:hypothetical protein